MILNIPTAVREVKANMTQILSAAAEDKNAGRQVLDDAAVNEVDMCSQALAEADHQVTSSESTWRQHNTEARKVGVYLIRLIRNFRQLLMMALGRGEIAGPELDVLNLRNLPKSKVHRIWRELAKEIVKTAAENPERFAAYSPGPDQVAEALNRLYELDQLVFNVKRQLDEQRNQRRTEVDRAIRAIRVVGRRFRETFYDKDAQHLRVIMRGYGFLFEGISEETQTPNPAGENQGNGSTEGNGQGQGNAEGNGQGQGNTEGNGQANS